MAFDMTQPGTIEIRMLGGFSISAGGKRIDDGTGRAKKCWNLLGYLIANRYSEIPKEKLIELLWPENESDDPANALKNLVYRTRKMLAPLLTGFKCEPILFRNNSYKWNNSLPCRVDTEEFEAAFLRARRPEKSPCERLADYRKAIGLYGGEFMPNASMADWVILYNTHYVRMYIDCVKGITLILLDREEYDEAIGYCEKALTIESYDESLHELLIRAYLGAGKRQKALSHYDYITELFYEKLGIRLSKNLRSMMESVIKTENGVAKNLETIKNDLRENEKIDGSYFCDYQVFRNLYRIEARLAERIGQTVFVALLTLEPVTPQPPPGSLDEMMRTLKDVILHNLRKSDVVSRYSSSQFILMLPAQTFENGQAILRRIHSIFDEKTAAQKPRAFRLVAKLNPLTPV